MKKWSVWPARNSWIAECFEIEAWVSDWAGWGIAGLLLAAFLAGSVLPAASEAVLVALLVAGGNPPVLVVVATVGNTLGAVTGWWLGRFGSDTILRRWFRLGPEAIERGQKRVKRWGAPVLLLTWIPVVGDPLTVAAGVFRISLPTFLAWVTTGKALRYIGVAWVTLRAIS